MFRLACANTNKPLALYERIHLHYLYSLMVRIFLLSIRLLPLLLLTKSHRACNLYNSILHHLG